MDGSDVTLTCTSTSSGVQTVQWYKDGQAEGSTSTSSELSLNPYAASTHDGEYSCEVTISGVMSLTSDYLTLTGSAQPTAPTISSSLTDIYEGSSPTLTCTSSSASSMTLTYEWFRSGTQVPGEFSSTYMILSADSSHDGMYTCKALVSSTVFSDISASFSVSVRQPPSKPLSVIGSLLAVPDGDSTTLTCNHGNTGTLTYTWMKDGQVVSGSASTLVVSSFASSDAGDYTCAVVEAPLSSPESDPLAVVYAAVPQTPSLSSSASSTVETGTSVTLTCATLSSHGTVTYSFLQETTEVQSGPSATYDLTSTAPSNSGSYTCVATIYNVDSAPSSADSLQVVDNPGVPTVLSNVADPNLGDDVTLTCSVTSVATITSYRWYKGSVQLTGEVAATLTFTNIQTTAAGSYTCKAFIDTVDSDQSQAYSVTVLVPPSQPTLASSLAQGMTVIATGSDVTFTCTATESDVTFKWYKGSDLVSGQSSSTYVLTSVDNTKEGTYSCKASNNAGDSPSSNSVSFTVQDPISKPYITSSQAVVGEGDDVTLTCNTDSSPVSAFTYSWVKDAGSPLSETGRDLQITGASQSTDGGSYTCTITDTLTSDPSNWFTLTVYTVPEKPTISMTPTTINVNDAVIMTCTSSSESSLSLTYEWLLDNNLRSETTKGLTLHAFNPSTDTGTYKCAAVHSGVKSAYSDGTSVALSGAPALPSLTMSPSSFAIGDSVTLECSTTTSAITTFSYSKNGVTVSGESASTLVISSFASTDTGGYTCRAISGSGVESVDSAELPVAPTGTPNTPVVTVSPTTFMDGTDVTLTCSSTSTGTKSYQWYKNGQAEGAASASGDLSLNPYASSTHDGEYSCEVTISGFTSLMSDSLTLVASTKPASPTISSSLTDIYKGSSPILTCTSTSASSMTLSYQWFRSGTQVPGEFSSTYMILSADSSHDGTYTCKALVSSAVFSDDSASFPLSVRQTPTKPSSVTATSVAVPNGGSTTLTCNHGNAGALTFIWEKDGVTVSGSASTLVLSSFTSSSAGDYTCAVREAPLTSLQSDPLNIYLAVAPNTPSLSSSPSTFNTGDAVTLTCTTTTMGSGITYQFLRDGTSVSDQASSTYSIGSFATSDTGAYTCTVTKDSLVSAESATVSLAANGAPARPSLTTSDAYVIAGNSATLTCASTSSGTKTYSWKKDGQAISGSDATLTVSSFSSSSEGSYTCQVTISSIPSLDSPVVDLTLAVGPANSVVLKKGSVVLGSVHSEVSSSDLNVTCEATCTPTCSFSWTKPDSSTVSSSTLSLTNLQLVHEGTYTCTATNLAGSAGQAFELRVTAGARAVTPTSLSFLMLAVVLSYAGSKL
ncbi:hemicentin-1 [Aplysia californica]|uniref:Hemicentin-1 n=1 Tax=Aplysia californica TaxID=6500 RepID=A0ABM0ZVR7_APLCA|nr:hemicentin-1 [Aplysia californica]